MIVWPAFNHCQATTVALNSTLMNFCLSYWKSCGPESGQSERKIVVRAL